MKLLPKKGKNHGSTYFSYFFNDLMRMNVLCDTLSFFIDNKVMLHKIILQLIIVWPFLHIHMILEPQHVKDKNREMLSLAYA